MLIIVREDDFRGIKILRVFFFVFLQVDALSFNITQLLPKKVTHVKTHPKRRGLIKIFSGNSCISRVC